MGGSNLVLLKVPIEDKSPIAELTIVRAHFTGRCHGHVFREKEKLEIDEGG